MVMYFNPIKVLMPLALLLFGSARSRRSSTWSGTTFRITTNAVLLVVTGLIIASVALLADLIVRSRSD